ncbi:hypothetical protein B0H15DRAFT_949981 [Mycena belliarum]|uniref:Uncharacterized protein n=1 Tax=Mycena belliarum TaxID=1033014 RepID=A0AAD6U7C4_9AGAR|nr:hypothetical protein B0H15DRAFT_949981 [Mycena belliae]
MILGTIDPVGGAPSRISPLLGAPMRASSTNQLDVTYRGVRRLDPSWNVKSSSLAARNMIIGDTVSVNWLVVQMPAGQNPVEDYYIDTLAAPRRVDDLFRAVFAAGTITVPVASGLKQALTAGDGASVAAAPSVSHKSPTPGSPLPLGEDDSDTEPGPMSKIFVIVSDERHGSSSVPRATILAVYKLEERGGKSIVDTRELIQELQSSAEAIIGSARLSVEVKVAAMVLRSSFYRLKEDAEYLGPPDVPELAVAQADPSTGCPYSIHIFLDTADSLRAVGKESEIKLEADSGMSGKRRFSTLSADDDDEDRTPGPEHPFASKSKSKSKLYKLKAVPSERDPAQLRWLSGPSGYSNVISAAIKAQVRSKQPSATCALSVFCAYMYIVSHITPGEACEAAGRFAIPNTVLGNFLNVAADWVGQAITAGRLQIEVGHIPVVKAHIDGDIPDSYLGIKPWIAFLKEAQKESKVDAAKIGTTE